MARAEIVGGGGRQCREFPLTFYPPKAAEPTVFRRPPHVVLYLSHWEAAAGVREEL